MMGIVIQYINREEAVDTLMQMIEPKNYEYTKGISDAIDAIRALPCSEECEVFPDDGK